MSTQNLIADRSYRNYDGPMRTVRAGWWVIAQSVIRTNIRKIAFWMPVLMIVLIHLFYGLVFFFNHNLAQGIRETGMGGGRQQTTFTYASCIALCINIKNYIVAVLFVSNVGRVHRPKSLVNVARLVNHGNALRWRLGFRHFIFRDQRRC